MQNKDHLLELCRPYLLDLSSAIVETLRYPHDQLSELLEGTGTRLVVEDFKKIYELTEIDKIRVLNAIATWMEQAERPTNSGFNRQ